MWSYDYSTELYHHGILGQKWGIRRYQNKDGTLTELGRKLLRKEASAFGETRGKSKNRLDVIKRAENRNKNLEYEKWKSNLTKKEEKNLKKYIDTGELKSYYDRHVMSDNEILRNRKNIDIFINEYADATLKDLKIKNTEDTKMFVKEIVKTTGPKPYIDYGMTSKEKLELNKKNIKRS